MANLLSDKIDISKIFSNENMKLCAWAKINLPAEYAQLKLNLKGKVNLKDFEKAVRHASKVRSANSDFAENLPLKLEGLELYGAIIPKGWNISLNHGIQKIFDDEAQGICPCALVILKHLPFALDELQVLNSRRQTVEHIIYSLGNGIGRLRGAKEGAIQETLNWHNIILTSGEQPMSKESSNDGVLTRALELYGKPCEDVNFAHNLHIMSVNNYGFAGKQYIKFIVDSVLSQRGKIKKDFEMLRLGIEKQNTEGKDTAHIDNISAVCLGDYYSSISVFGKDEETAKNEAILLGAQILKNTKDFEKADTTDRAWDFVVGWIASNKNRFLPDSTPCYGKIENESVYIIPSILREALEENSFDYSKVTRGFKERGFIETIIDSKGHTKMQLPKRINGIVQKCFVVREVVNSANSNSENPVAKPL